MDFTSRFPTRQETSTGFAVTAFPIFVRAIIVILRKTPSWILGFNIFELVGVYSYVLMFALLESLLVFGALWLFSALLPGRWYRDRFVAHTFGITWLLAIWLYIQQQGLPWFGPQSSRFLLVAVASLTLSQILVYYLVARFARVRSTLSAVAEALSVLTYVYVLLGLIGTAIVIFRNLP